MIAAWSTLHGMKFGPFLVKPLSAVISTRSPSIPAALEDNQDCKELRGPDSSGSSDDDYYSQPKCHALGTKGNRSVDFSVKS